MSLRRILYVPGVRAKPPPEIHRVLLWRCVLEGIRRADPMVAKEMAAAPDCLHMVLWGHLMYQSWRDSALDEPGIAALFADDQPSTESIREIFGWRRRAEFLAHRLGDRIPRLINLLAGDNTRLNIADSQRYFANVDGIGDRIRGLLRAELRRAWQSGDHVLLMAHSFGSVIAWDTLWTLREEAGPVDLFLTLGSPLGTRFVRQRLLGASGTGVDRYPRGIREWRNLAAIGGLPALGHRFADDFAEMRELGLVDSITDRTDLINPFRGPEGLNVHKCYAYFVNALTGAAIAAWWRSA
ncbi:MAG: hypothetical protein R3F24_04420 [Gammaproteobacteria bacterium]